MSRLSDALGTNRTLIGALHFPPLPTFEGFTSLEEVLEFSLKNAEKLEKAGFDSIIVENNYDLPHLIKVGPETISVMKYLTKEIMKQVSIPIGISVLWNSFGAAFEIAKETNAKYIRVPVFVDRVETSYGKVIGEPEKVIEVRKNLNADDVLILADIQVKHSKLLNVRPISEAAKEAVEKGADGLIVTGNWTGDSPKMGDLKQVRLASGKDFPIIVGSGATKENIKSLMSVATGVIIGTDLKEFDVASREKHVNLVGPYTPISEKKAKEFVEAFRLATK
ncbi:hypothetical protein A2886_02845 [candidate division WWE3 bacterium RIFCSPHIGHO2_01_FULL_42_13]|uniref:Photosystem I assembly BtpA n=1 Tax=candidate division WWE3 bacterium RIFCSPHIGHO2_01_FULL_42_13 TaxID=1802617 RepID=A0A1F4URZ8_UNCKA|nr:MAG: hypothetical protein A2886_02845 [candidate division WWE3 bacterium RIFCSPHIGHO2_01_FULL_42_13]